MQSDCSNSQLTSSLQTNRIFLPKNFDPESLKKLPTLFTIHGGAFIAGCTQDDDNVNHALSNMHSMLVIGLNYSKAPRIQFPTPTYDLEQLVLAALSDTTLPIDEDRVALMGSSAGGNLALSLSQLPSMCGSGDGVRRIKTIIAMYPVADLSIKREYKAQSRQYKPELGDRLVGRDDGLYPIMPIKHTVYIPPGQDLQDPLLSPIYAARTSLPPNVFIVGEELDMLSNEAWRMICGLTGRDVGHEAPGQSSIGPFGELILDDERFSFEVNTDDGNYKWLLIPDQLHGHDHPMKGASMIISNRMLEDAKLKTEKVQRLIGEWLFRGPFA